jgi:hypothetical protein
MSMTPERIEAYRKYAHLNNGLSLEDAIELLAALEESQQNAEVEQKLNDTLHSTNKDLRKKLVEAQLHREIDQANYKTYYAEANKVSERLAEAQQTIARQREALKLIADMKIIGNSHVSMQAIARGELNKETQIVQKCERCGCNYVKKDDSYVCGFCLDELEEEEGSDKA